MTDQKTTLEVGGLHWATSQSVIENELARRPGVKGVVAASSP